MSRTWRLTDLEFVVLWEDSVDDFLPSPFVFTSRTPLWDDYLREKRQTRERLAASGDASLREAVAMLARPDIRIEAGGWDPRNPADPAAVLRVIAARRGPRGVLATQLPGETVRHSGGYTFTECDALALADVVAAALPAAEAGCRAQVVLAELDTHDEMDYTYGRSDILAPADARPRERTAAFLDAPVTGVGLISVVQGRSKFGPRGMIRRELAWRDLENDGRYAIVDGTPPVALAVAPARLVDLINVEIAAVVQAIKDERA